MDVCTPRVGFHLGESEVLEDAAGDSDLSQRFGLEGLMTQSVFKPFEHQWALAQAFGLNGQLGRRRLESDCIGSAAR